MASGYLVRGSVVNSWGQVNITLMNKDDNTTPNLDLISLPWFETLRTFLESYNPVCTELQADTFLTSGEIIRAIEAHHGIPQGIVGKEVHCWVDPENFVEAMRYLGFQDINMAGDGLQWIMCSK